MRKTIPILMFAAAACSVWLATGSNASSQPNTNRKDKLKQLLQERLALAEKMHGLVNTGYRGGDQKYSFAVVHDAKVKWLAARLDLTETKEQRIKVHGDMVRDAAEYEQVVSQVHNAGGGSYVDVLNAKVYHLERLIALERAKAD